MALCPIAPCAAPAAVCDQRTTVLRAALSLSLSLLPLSSPARALPFPCSQPLPVRPLVLSRASASPVVGMGCSSSAEAEPSQAAPANGTTLTQQRVGTKLQRGTTMHGMNEADTDRQCLLVYALCVDLG